MRSYCPRPIFRVSLRYPTAAMARGCLRIAPGADDRGDYVVTLTATDDGDGGGERARLSTSRQFVISAEAPSEAPRLLPIGDKVALTNQTLSFVVGAVDLDQDLLTFSAEGLPSVRRSCR